MQIINIFQQIINQLIDFLPQILYAALTLIIGYLVGHYFGKALNAIISRLKMNEKFEETDIGSSLGKAGYTFSGLIAITFKIFIYLLTIMVALNFLKLPLINQVSSVLTIYLPRIVGAVVVFLVGIIIIDWLTNLIAGVMTGTSTILGRFFVSGIKYLMYIVLILMALDIAQIATSVTKTVAQSILFALGIGGGLAFALMIGLGFKEDAKIIFSSDLNVLKENQNIKVGKLQGKVKRIAFLTVELENEKGARIILPKKKLLDEGFEILD